MPALPFLKPIAALSLVLSLGGAHAAVFGDFTYSVENEAIRITDFPESFTGAVTIPNTIEGKPVKTIGANAFSNCTQVTGVTLPGTVTTIESSAFSGCRLLPAIILPTGLRTLGNYAFRGCSSLTTINIPTVTDTIGVLPFLDCTQLAEITTLQGGTTYAADRGVLYTKDFTTLIQCPPGKTGDYVTATWVETIPSRGFSGCSKLTSLKLTGSLTSIGADAFEYCTSITRAEIPASLQTIPFGAFKGCTSLRSVEMPSGWGVETIGAGAFADCVSLIHISFSSVLRSIEYGAFRNCRSLTLFNLGSSIASLGDGVWAGCTSLRTISLPADYGGSIRATDGTVTHNGQLVWCSTFKGGSFEIPSDINYMGAYTFDGCTQLTDITFPNSGSKQVELRANALANCPNLHTVQLSAGNASHYAAALGGSPTPPRLILGGLPESAVLSASALKGLAGLAYVELPYSLEAIPTSAFQNCVDLETVVFRSSVNRIGVSAFAGCQKLRTVTLPASVSSIGTGAFANSGLERLAFLGNAPTIEEGAFDTLPAEFHSYYFGRYTGFTTPLWKGRESVDMGADVRDKVWRVEHRLPYDIPLTHEPNGGGISLLIAYALTLDPNRPLGPQMPTPRIDDGKLKIAAVRNSPGIFYAFETSTDLTSWTSSGVSLTPGIVTEASVPYTGSPRFLRIRVTKN